MKNLISESSWITANWPAPECIKAGVTTRLGGTSKKPYNTFNLAQHVGDDFGIVVENRRLLQELLNLPSNPVWLNQIHSNVVINAEDHEISASADGAYTKKKDCICAIKTADCLPLLLCNQQGTEIAAIHIGWRGFSKNIIDKALERFASKRCELIAWLGPCISASNYEVGIDVYEACRDIYNEAERGFKFNGRDYWFADLRILVTEQLMINEIHMIYGCGSCTYSTPDLFYSYRREGTTGRMASLIWIDSLKT